MRPRSVLFLSFLRISAKWMFLKMFLEFDIPSQNVSNFAGLVWKANFWHCFGNWVLTQCVFFKIDFRVETMSPRRSIWIPWTLLSEQFFSGIKWSEPFCRSFPNRKMALISYIHKHWLSGISILNICVFHWVYKSVQPFSWGAKTPVPWNSLSCYGYLFLRDLIISALWFFFLK